MFILGDIFFKVELPFNKSIGADTHFKSWGGVPDFRSCNAKTAGNKWGAKKWKRQQTVVCCVFVVCSLLFL